jgi:hypothetical protein
VQFEKDDFEAWRENPITRAVLKLLSEEAESARNTWIQHSWAGGEADSNVLYEMRGRAHICELIMNLDEEELNGSSDDD